MPRTLNWRGFFYDLLFGLSAHSDGGMGKIYLVHCRDGLQKRPDFRRFWPPRQALPATPPA